LNGFGFLEGQRIAFGHNALAITHPSNIGSVGSGEEIVDFDGIVADKSTGKGIAINNGVKAE